MKTLTMVFDAHCLLCSGWVQFLLKHDHNGILRFASMQSVKGAALLRQAGLDPTHLETLLVIANGQPYCYTAAVFRLLHAIGWPWRLAWLGWLVPAPPRDSLYRYVARNRYRLFGRSDKCFLPSQRYLKRFID